ncbi:hypothetical protein C8A01DRAFT_19882 [Parachaetomium inaequale]|uniref:Uncharacterized protein n=1 Tax=Parachaetomium inaequale TaxID=2588326 RepID=A0AAN6P9A8_9PEZI|nr:hypothetical protein C8A01DRAFT_19882 [Parachaetomium inaequale]
MAHLAPVFPWRLAANQLNASLDESSSPSGPGPGPVQNVLQGLGLTCFLESDQQFPGITANARFEVVMPCERCWNAKPRRRCVVLGGVAKRQHCVRRGKKCSGPNVADARKERMNETDIVVVLTRLVLSNLSGQEKHRKILPSPFPFDFLMSTSCSQVVCSHGVDVPNAFSA